MIPLRDATPSENYPVMNNTLIGINIVVFIAGLAGRPEAFNFMYGIVPRRYTDIDGWLFFSPGAQVLPFFSYMFLHGGFWHVLGNMWSLYIFGDNIEGHLGSVKYLFFYLACGVFAAFAHILLNVGSSVPTIGASGAVAGVMGAYFLLFPGSRILSLVPLFFIPVILEIPASVFLGAWFLMQFLNATANNPAAVAWWAHVGGFLFGLFMVRFIPRIPFPGDGGKLKTYTQKKKTPHIQIVRVSGSGGDGGLYGTITVTPYEALTGTRKLVNIQAGFRTRLYRVAIPSGTKSGQKLRLRGLGKTLPDGAFGDIMLHVIVIA